MEQPSKKPTPDKPATPPKADDAVIERIVQSAHESLPKQPAQPPQALMREPLSPAEAALRNQFACVALAEIVKIQILERKAGQEDVAASWAFRYADRMLEQSRKAPKAQPIYTKGKPSPMQEIIPPQNFVEHPEPIAEVS